MPDTYFLQPWHVAGEKSKVAQIEIVAGVDAQADVSCVGGSPGERSNCSFPVLVVLMSRDPQK